MTGLSFTADITGWQSPVYLEIHLVFISCYLLAHLFAVELVENTGWHMKEWQREHLRRLAAQRTLKRGQSRREASQKQKASRVHQTNIRKIRKGKMNLQFPQLWFKLIEQKDVQTDGFVVFFLISWNEIWHSHWEELLVNSDTMFMSSAVDGSMSPEEFLSWAVRFKSLVLLLHVVDISGCWQACWRRWETQFKENNPE